MVSRPEGEAPGGAIQLVVVRMGGRPCAIPCQDVVEIIPRVLLSHVPDAPPLVLGVINLRGGVVPVLDLRSRVSGNATPPAYQHLVIVRAGGAQVGVVVDEVCDVRAVAADAVVHPGQLAGSRAPGVVRIDDEIALVLGPEQLQVHGAEGAARVG